MVQINSTSWQPITPLKNRKPSLCREDAIWNWWQESQLGQVHRRSTPFNSLSAPISIMSSFFWQTNFGARLLYANNSRPSGNVKYGALVSNCFFVRTKLPLFQSVRHDDPSEDLRRVCGHFELEQITTSFGVDNPPPPPLRGFSFNKRARDSSNSKEGLWTTARQTSTWINLIFGFGLFTPKNSVEA